MQQREVLLLAEMIDAAEEARRLVADRDLVALETDRQTRDAHLPPFAAQLHEVLSTLAQ